MGFKGWFVILALGLLIIHFHWLRGPARTADPQPKPAQRTAAH